MRAMEESRSDARMEEMRARKDEESRREEKRERREIREDCMSGIDAVMERHARRPNAR